ncbi:RICIN domain-containing protein [Nocardia mexicana]|uniref:Uncharacterized protein n=1 Tax=Nocardia mexicana TaxID=279262 RepID=A0A370HET7_9NOCA|nr:hypothetical protein [Nocardia mexicana]RDI55542.1 hypothetical protein DFR68_101375 [Nocardia mexicana]
MAQPKSRSIDRELTPPQQHSDAMRRWTTISAIAAMVGVVIAVAAWLMPRTGSEGSPVSAAPGSSGAPLPAPSISESTTTSQRSAEDTGCPARAQRISSYGYSAGDQESVLDVANGDFSAGSKILTNKAGQILGQCWRVEPIGLKTKLGWALYKISNQLDAESVLTNDDGTVVLDSYDHRAAGTWWLADSSRAGYYYIHSGSSNDCITALGARGAVTIQGCDTDRATQLWQVSMGA